MKKLSSFILAALLFISTFVSLPASASAQLPNSLYQVENQWGGSSAPWHNGGKWVIGGRSNQGVVGLNLKSGDGGKTFNGTMTYAGEGPIGFRGTMRS